MSEEIWCLKLFATWLTVLFRKFVFYWIIHLISKQHKNTKCYEKRKHKSVFVKILTGGSLSPESLYKYYTRKICITWLTLQKSLSSKIGWSNSLQFWYVRRVYECAVNKDTIISSVSHLMKGGHPEWFEKWQNVMRVTWNSPRNLNDLDIVFLF